MIFFNKSLLGERTQATYMRFGQKGKTMCKTCHYNSMCVCNLSLPVYKLETIAFTSEEVLSTGGAEN